MGSFFSLGKSSNDTQENPKDALKKEEELKEVREENAKLNDKNDLAREKGKLDGQNKTLIETNQELTAEKRELNNKITGLSADKERLTKDKTDLTNKNAKLQKRVKELEQSQQALKNGNDELLKDREKLTTQNTELVEKNKALTTEKTELNNKITGLVTEKERLAADKERLTKERDDLTKEKENLTTALSTAKGQAEQASQKLNELEQRHAPYQKLEKLYEVFLEVKDRLNFNFVATTHSAMDLIASVLSDSKYYLESLYNKASQELSDKRSDKGEKLAELFDLLFEYIKDSKFERLKEPSAYDHSCKTLYPEQNSSQKMQRVVLRGYTYDKKIACYTIVDVGS
ncbi:hypothetical protein [Helicobacter pylori]|uniref:hypothetical protein n=2 Tax=Helicobacter pylori TaxID=210 RepID=UPI001E34872F|nr:hypothetical protein [Helicobacter pylori]